MPVSVKHSWPPHFQDKPIHPSVRVLTGCIALPPELPSGILAYVEADSRFHRTLWPPCRADGYQRYGRQFHWEDGGRTLHYRIIDLPASREVA